MSFPSFLSPPRLCHLKKWTTFVGYGFNLHAEKGKAGQYIGKVDPSSPAEHGGLKAKDYLVEVNGINVEDLSHQRVVEIVKETAQSVTMLVVDMETYKYCKENQIAISSSMPDVVLFNTPHTQPTTVGAIEEEQEIHQEAVQQEQNEAPTVEDEAAVELSNKDPPENEGSDFNAVDQELIPPESEQQQQQQNHRELSPTPPQQQQQEQQAGVSNSMNGSSSGKSAAATAAAAKDPVGNVSLEEIRAKIGNNRRTQVKMNPSSFSEKSKMFQAL